MNRFRELRGIHREFMFLYLGHSICRQMADAARNVQAEVPESLTSIRGREAAEDWPTYVSLMVDSLAYHYDNIADDYFSRMEDNQARFRQVTALAEDELATLMEEARQNEQRQADETRVEAGPSTSRGSATEIRNADMMDEEDEPATGSDRE